jgi:hypothetical protein
MSPCRARVRGHARGIYKRKQPAAGEFIKIAIFPAREEYLA